MLTFFVTLIGMIFGYMAVRIWEKDKVLSFIEWILVRRDLIQIRKVYLQALTEIQTMANVQEILNYLDEKYMDRGICDYLCRTVSGSSRTFITSCIDKITEELNKRKIYSSKGNYWCKTPSATNNAQLALKIRIDILDSVIKHNKLPTPEEINF